MIIAASSDLPRPADALLVPCLHSIITLAGIRISVANDTAFDRHITIYAKVLHPI